MPRYFRRAKQAAVALLIIALSLVPTVAAERSSAQTAIADAKNTLKNCYEAAKQAENAGASVEPLMVTLNDASALLSKADLAFASEDYSLAYNYAKQSQNKLSGFLAQANALKDSAAENRNQNYIFTLFSAFTSLGILFSGVVAWVILNEKERRSHHGIS
ncbi:MAG: hypothetical protein NWE98_10360 [Candidatus Bathyarchaeota archaeon]|nr:hypothetical protein [Candidatus Bathyarchaeota archaeon]